MAISVLTTRPDGMERRSGDEDLTPLVAGGSRSVEGTVEVSTTSAAW
jgi:hypothetical protein